MENRIRYNVYANIVTLIHFLWTFLVFGGALYLLFHHSYAVIQIIVLTITLFSSIPFGNACPLTLLEERLRQKLNPTYKNQGSFMTTYINKMLKTNFSVKEVNLVIAILYILSYSFAAFVLIH